MRISVFCRRLLCCLLACLLLVPAAVSETVNLSKMSDDEIVALLSSVNAEIVRRGIAKTATLSKGSYIAGRDLPAGRYILTVLAKGDDWGNVTVKSNRGSGDLKLWEVVSAPDNGEDPDTFVVSLDNGDELKSGVPFSLTVMTGVVFK